MLRGICSSAQESTSNIRPWCRDRMILSHHWVPPISILRWVRGGTNRDFLIGSETWLPHAISFEHQKFQVDNADISLSCLLGIVLWRSIVAFFSFRFQPSPLREALRNGSNDDLGDSGLC